VNIYALCARGCPPFAGEAVVIKLWDLILKGLRHKNQRCWEQDHVCMDLVARSILVGLKRTLDQGTVYSSMQTVWNSNSLVCTMGSRQCALLCIVRMCNSDCGTIVLIIDYAPLPL